MKCFSLLLLLLIFNSCKKKEDDELSFVEFCNHKERQVLEATSTSVNNQKLFLNYKLYLNKSEFNEVTAGNIEQKILIKEDAGLKFPLHTDSNPYPYYFSVNSEFDNDSLKSINLHVKCYIHANASRQQQSHYSYYYRLLSEKYGETNAEYSDENTREAFWINHDVVISIREEEIIKTDYYTPAQEFVNLAISYSDLKKVQRNYKESLFEREKIEKRQKEIINKERDSLNKQSQINTQAF